jgi:hypothetical protein
MEQRSDVQFRAEKIYKNSREKFGYLLREIVSNSIHATIIRKSKEFQNNYKPKVEILFNVNETSVNITLNDNGEGFNELNRRYFTHLDLQNPEKDKLNLHPKGQGRLAIIFFTDSATYSSIYIDSEKQYRVKNFNYPEFAEEISLFDIEGADGATTDQKETGTKLVLNISRQQTFGRANTFFSKYDDSHKIKNWFVENFFPFFMEVPELCLEINFNGSAVIVNKAYIETAVKSIPFSAKLGREKPQDFEFILWLVEKTEPAKTKNQIICFARHLRAEIEDGKLEYEIDLLKSYDWLLTSRYFDDNVDQKGDRIEIGIEDILGIQEALNLALDKHFKNEIALNQKETKRNINTAKTKYHSLSVFVDDTKIESCKRVLREQDIISAAVESKGKIEKSYWTSQETKEEDVAKLLNSSLHIYIDHRGRILNIFRELVKKYDIDGDVKPELEDSIHDILMKRGQNLKDSNQINHLHNLWILDDKYAIFSDSQKGVSTKNGQGLSDIYFWIDDPEKTKELLILELKSTTSAHNAGNKYESMVAQVKKYASQFYNDPVKTINWSIDPDSILYSGIILARKSDVYKELASNNIGGIPNKIPFLESSFYFNETFAVATSKATIPKRINIKIDMYSYEDIYNLAANRNTVFLNLLNGEFNIDIENNNKKNCPPEDEFKYVEATTPSSE